MLEAAALQQITHWSEEAILDRMTDGQGKLWLHAFWVNSERGERRQKRQRFCEYCGKPAVSENDWGERQCGKCNRIQPGSGNSSDVIVHDGMRFEGDADEGAMAKFKRYCLQTGRLGEYKRYAEGLGGR